jgi:type IV pilus assembly protein PilX
MNLSKTIQNERGAVLITGLMLILLLTLIGLAAMQSTTLQERMAGNMQQRDLAFQSAEAGLRDAENYIGGLALLPAFNNTGGLHTPVTDGTTPRWDLVDWDAATPNYFTYQAGDLGATPPYPLPKYIIEYVAGIEDEADDSEAYGPSGTKSEMLRITSRSVSPNGRSVLRLQTTYLR